MKIQGLWPVRVHTSWPRKAVGNGGKKAGCNVERARRRDADGGNDYEEFKTTLAEMNEKINDAVLYPQEELFTGIEIVMQE